MAKMKSSRTGIKHFTTRNSEDELIEQVPRFLGYVHQLDKADMRLLYRSIAGGDVDSAREILKKNISSAYNIDNPLAFSAVVMELSKQVLLRDDTGEEVYHEYERDELGVSRKYEKDEEEESYEEKEGFEDAPMKEIEVKKSNKQGAYKKARPKPYSAKETLFIQSRLKHGKSNKQIKTEYAQKYKGQRSMSSLSTKISRERTASGMKSTKLVNDKKIL